MKLQIKTSGAWKDIFQFDATRANEVEDAAAALSRAAGVMGWKLSVVDNDGTRRYLNERGVFRAANEGGRA